MITAVGKLYPDIPTLPQIKIFNNLIQFIPFINFKTQLLVKIIYIAIHGNWYHPVVMHFLQWKLHIWIQNHIIIFFTNFHLMKYNYLLDEHNNLLISSLVRAIRIVQRLIKSSSTHFLSEQHQFSVSYFLFIRPEFLMQRDNNLLF